MIFTDFPRQQIYPRETAQTVKSFVLKQLYQQYS